MKIYRDAFVDDDLYSRRGHLGRCSPRSTLVLSFGFLRLVQPRAFGEEREHDGRRRHARRAGRHRADAGRARRSCCRPRCCCSGAVYCLLPVALGGRSRRPRRAASCSPPFTLRARPGGWSRTSRDLSAYRGRAVLALDGSTPRSTPASAPLLSAVVSGAHRVRAGEVPLPRPRRLIFNVLLAGVLVPAIVARHPAVPAAGQGRARRHLLVGAAAQHPQPVRHLPVPAIYAAAAVPDATARGGPHRRRRRVPALPVGRAADDGARPGDHVPVPVRRDLEQLPAAVHHARATTDKFPLTVGPLHAAQPGRATSRPSTPW